MKDQDNQDNSVIVPAEPGYEVLIIDGDTSHLYHLPVLAWDIVLGGRAYPITAGFHRLHFNKVQPYGLMFPDGHVEYWDCNGEDDDVVEFLGPESFERDIRSKWSKEAT